MSKIAQFVFHGIYSSAYMPTALVPGGPDGGIFEYRDRNDIPIGPVLARTGGSKDPQYFNNPEGSSEYIEGAKYKKFETEEEVVNYHRTSYNTSSSSPEGLPNFKNYIKFERKDFAKYRGLFHGMLKTAKVTSTTSHEFKRKEVQMKLEPNPSYRPCPPTCPPVGKPYIIRKKIFDFNSKFEGTIEIDGNKFENDKNFQNRVPLTTLSYNLNDDSETLSIGGGGFQLYKDKWQFNSDVFRFGYFLNPFNSEANIYPLDRTNLNQPVLGSPFITANLASYDEIINFNIAGFVNSNHQFFNKKESTKNLSSLNPGNVDVKSSINYNIEEGYEPTIGFFYENISLSAFQFSEYISDGSSLYYIESTKEFLYFIEFFSICSFLTTPYFMINAPEHIISTIPAFLARSKKYQSGPNEEKNNTFKVVKINLTIDGIDEPFTIEALQGINPLKWEDKDSKNLSDSISDSEVFTGQTLVNAVLEMESKVDFSNLNIHLYSWNENNFDINNPFPAPL